MSNLVKTDLSPSLSPHDKAIVEASISKQIKEMSAIDIASQIVSSIVEAYTILKHNPKSDEDVSATSLIIANKLKDSSGDIGKVSRTLTIEDVNLSIRRGAFGDYSSDGDVLHISPSNIIKWTQKYLETKDKALLKQREYLIKLEVMENERGAEKNQIDFLKSLPKNVGNELKLYKEGTYGKLSWLYYSSLDNMGLIPFTKEIKLKIFDEAVEINRKEIREKGQNPIKVGEDNIKKSAKNIARRMALHKWFEIMEHQGEDVIEWVKKEVETYLKIK